MNSLFPPVRSRALTLVPLLVTCACAISACASTPATSPSPSLSPIDARPLNFVTVPSEALGDNLLGEPAERDVTVYLPPQYFTGDESFPVVYYLAGHSSGRTIANVTVPRDLDSAFEEIDPMIVVIIDGLNTFQGSFYVDSTTTGGWATFVTEDVVGYVDGHYRTIPQREARGISGHSMGGFGAWDIAMRNPDVFGSVYMVAPGLYNEEGSERLPWLGAEGRIRAMIDLIDESAALDPDAGLAHMAASQLGFDIGYGMAFAPSDDFPYFEYPYSVEGDVLVLDDDVLARWNSGFGGIEEEVVEYGNGISSLLGIGIDCGTNDEYRWIPPGCAYLDAELTEAGIDHVYTVHTGNHTGRHRERVLEYMLPFFEDVFAS
jgi:S-formylglutathione hydrolase